MGVKITFRQTVNVLLVISWIIFVGLCVEAAGFLVNAYFAIVNPAFISRLYRQVDLSDLLKYDQWHFFGITFIIGVTAIMKAWLFYLILKMLHNKDLNIAQPFSKKVQYFIFRISYFTFFIGVLSWYGVNYTSWLIEKGVKMPDSQFMRIGGADVWLFMAIVLYIIAQIFKRGIEIQSENDLTI